MVAIGENRTFSFTKNRIDLDDGVKVNYEKVQTELDKQEIDYFKKF